MEWYHYIACFFSGLFLANVVPHFVHGVSGNKFPTPFAKPSGKGLSSPTVNIIWALVNLLIGYILFQAGHTAKSYCTLFVFFAGIAVISIFASRHFQGKDKE